MTYSEFCKRYRWDAADPTQLLGEGSFGKVYRAKDTHDNVEVALKIAPVRHKEGLNLQHEVSLHHQYMKDGHLNIVNYKDCYRFQLPEGESDYAILQYYPDGNLLELMKTKLTDAQKMNIARQILDGICYYQQVPIFHRDLKPENILIAKNRTGDYVPKIGDFGISKAGALDGSHVAHTIVGGGTLRYAAPEQLSGEYKTQYSLNPQLSLSADLWSYGVLVYYLFLGELPFPITYTHDMPPALKLNLHLLMLKSFQDIPKLDLLPPAIQQVVASCLVYDPTKRVKNAAVLRQQVKFPLNEVPSPNKDGETIVVIKPTQPTSNDTHETTQLAENQLLTGNKDITQGADPVPLPPPPNYWVRFKQWAQPRQWKLISIVSISTVIALLISPSGNEQAAQRHYQAANEHFKANELDKALLNLDKAMAQHPNPTAQYYQLHGRTQYELAKRAESNHDSTKWDKAIQDLNQAVRLDSLDYWNHWYRGLANEAAQRYLEAATDFTATAILNMSFMEAHRHRGNMYFYLQDYNEALSSYFEVVRAAPNDAAAHNVVGCIKQAMGSDSAALIDFDFSLSIDKNQHAFNNRGNSHHNLKHYDAAVSDFSQAIELNAHNALFYVNRATTYFEKGDIEAALKDYTKALDLNPIYSLRSMSYLGQGKCFKRKQWYPKAVTAFTSAIQYDPQNAWAYVRRAQVQNQLEQYRAALADVDAAIALQSKVARIPFHPQVYAERGKANFYLKNYSTAILDGDSAIAADPFLKDAYKYRGLAKLAKLQYAAAILDFDKNCALSANDSLVYFQRGFAKKALNDFKGAIADWDTTILLAPKNPILYKERALAKLEDKQPRPALEDLERAVALMPNDPILYNGQGKAYYDLKEYAKAVELYDKAKTIGGKGFKPPYEYRELANAKIPKNPSLPRTVPSPTPVPMPPIKARLPRK